MAISALSDNLDYARSITYTFHLDFWRVEHAHRVADTVRRRARPDVAGDLVWLAAHFVTHHRPRAAAVGVIAPLQRDHRARRCLRGLQKRPGSVADPQPRRQHAQAYEGE